MNKIEDPLVVALDGDWGSGKPYFLKRWVGQHLKENKDSTVVYFDAFAHNYISDPLPALVTALEGQTNNKNIKRMKRAVYKLAKTLALAGSRAVLAGATSGASEVVGNVGSRIINSIGDQAEKNLEEYWERGGKGEVSPWSNSGRHLNQGAPKKKDNKVIIVIDELDRCRPDYALEVLEVIKQFFSVDNVHFVLGVNLEVLENMV